VYHCPTCDYDQAGCDTTRHVHEDIPNVLTAVGCLVCDSLQLLQEAVVHLGFWVHVLQHAAVGRVRQELLEVLNPVLCALQHEEEELSLQHEDEELILQHEDEELILQHEG